MRVSKLIRITGIALIAASAVAGIHAIDAKRQQANQTTLSLRWTRQMVTQAESLALSADARGENDPLTWAARVLSQGTDSRIIYASKTQLPTPVTEPENYSLDPTTGIFDYTKVFDVQDGTGIRIRLYTTRTGLFGAKTILQHDLTVAALFLLIYGFLFLATWARNFSSTSAGPAITEWVTDAKSALVELGTHIREMVRSAHQICIGSRETKNRVGLLRERIHDQLEQIHLTAKNTSEVYELSKAVEIVLGQKNSLNPETVKLLKRLLALTIRQSEALTSTELLLEPLATDADLAFESLEMIGKTTDGFASEIKHTTEGMLDQARRMGELKKKGA
jgi:hypothetical protein